MFTEYYLPVRPGNHDFLESQVHVEGAAGQNQISPSFPGISNICLGESTHVLSFDHLTSSSPPGSAPVDLSPPSLLPTEDPL